MVVLGGPGHHEVSAPMKHQREEEADEANDWPEDTVDRGAVSEADLLDDLGVVLDACVAGEDLM